MKSACQCRLEFPVDQDETTSRFLGGTGFAAIDLTGSEIVREARLSLLSTEEVVDPAPVAVEGLNRIHIRQYLQKT